jgi:hypothetical protein
MDLGTRIHLSLASVFIVPVLLTKGLASLLHVIMFYGKKRKKRTMWRWDTFPSPASERTNELLGLLGSSGVYCQEVVDYGCGNTECSQRDPQQVPIVPEQDQSAHSRA